MLAPSSFCWPNLGCESPLAETLKGSPGRGEGCTFPLPLWSSNRRESGKRDIHGSRDIHGLQLVLKIMLIMCCGGSSGGALGAPPPADSRPPPPGADLGGGRGGRGPPFRQGTMPPHPPSRARASPSDDCYAVNRPPLFQNPGSAPAPPHHHHHQPQCAYNKLYRWSNVKLVPPPQSRNPGSAPDVYNSYIRDVKFVLY